MQTLQTARLTTKPLPTPPSTSTSSREAQPTTRTIQKPPGILRHRAVASAADEKRDDISDPRTVTLLARFLISQGAPLELVEEPAFREFMKFVNSKEVIPQVDTLENYIGRQAANQKPLINLQKTIGPLSVTIDVIGNDDKQQLVFSVHFFEDTYFRKHATCLRNLLVTELDSESILNTIRRAINATNYSSVKLTNLVVPNMDIFNMLGRTEVVKQYHICFYNYITMFVADVLEIEEFSMGLSKLREFIRLIKKHSDCYGKFRRMQLSKNADLDVPCVDEGPWCNTVTFLTKCLVLHDTFVEYCERHGVGGYITNETFTYLVYLQRLLQQCLKHCRDLSAPMSSISQIVPAIFGLQTFLTTHAMGYRFQPDIRSSLTTIFAHVMSGPSHIRYNTSTFLDPRYAYRDSIYTSNKWKEWETHVVEEFVNLDPVMEKYFPPEIGAMELDERQKLIQDELVVYRTVSFVERPEDADSPFMWWGTHQSQMPHLSIMAREFLACPAVSVDASYYFMDHGKMGNLCDLYSRDRVEPILTASGSYQQFRGRGASANRITPGMMETLNTTAARLHKSVHFAMYTHDMDATEQEHNTITTSFYPPPPVLGNKNAPKYEYPEGKPEVVGSTGCPPGGVTFVPTARPVHAPKRGRPIHFKGRELKPIPIRQVPLQGKQLPTPGNHLPVAKVIIAPPKGLSRPSQDPPEDEQKPKDVIEKEIKEEVIEPNMELVKDEPLDEDFEEPAPPQQPPLKIQVLKKVPPETLRRLQYQQSQNLQILKNKPLIAKKPPMESLQEPKQESQAHKMAITTLQEPKEELVEAIIQEVKQEPEDALEEPKQEPVTKTIVLPPQPHRKVIYVHKPPPGHAAIPIRQTNGQYIRVPASAPMPQKIAPHNFVQKFAGKQNFIAKIPVNKSAPINLPPPISIRAPIPSVVYKLPTLEKKPDDMKLEALDDFEEGLIDAPGSVYTQVLNETSAAQAYERHQCTLEMHKRRSCNRRCAVCSHMETHQRLKNVTIDNEKLLIMLGCIYRGELTIAEAQAFMARETKTYICRLHFGETLDEIYAMLKLHPNSESFAPTVADIQNVMITSNLLRAHISTVQLRKILKDFVDKYKHLREAEEDRQTSPIHVYPPPHAPIMSTGITLPQPQLEEDILPKVHRQPRKQVLEADLHDATVKVIEQEDFKLPTAIPNEDVECDNPGRCCYCSKRSDRSIMLRVPRGEDRLARWVEKLGPEFQSRLNMEEENLICRHHFPERAFSSRGRLLKGMIPLAAPEKVEVTYKIQGNDFLRLKTRKSGTVKSATINLAEGQEYDSEEEEEDSCDEMFESTPLPPPKPKRPVGRPRKYAVKQEEHSSGGEFYEEEEEYDMEPQHHEAALSDDEILADDEGMLASGDTDYVPIRKSSTGSQSMRKRGRPRKYGDEDEDNMLIPHKIRKPVVKREGSEGYKSSLPNGGRYNVRVGGRFAKLGP